jgi:cytochrome c oxidase accessory protein FixG
MTALVQEKGAAPASFYAAAQKIYPRETRGRFANLRRSMVVVLLGLYYGVAWLQWQGHQALLFDLPARKFHIFGLTLWPQDFFYMALLMIMAALSLFFATALAGRVWCGYACPQTVWTELFIWIEQWTEGDRSRRMKLDQSAWSVQKLLRKLSKQSLWLLLAGYTGFTFVGYFTPIRELGGQILSLSLGGWSAFWIGMYSLATYGNAGFLREQVCKYMCPYARFQSVMFDSDSLVISYDQARGEPRGARRIGSNARAQRLGDCIDCTLCVQVCPTGIDIRHGLQYECIACAACIDACDGVMDRMGSPRGLVRYTTENALAGNPKRLARPRVAVYALILLAGASTLVYSLVTRTPLIMDVLRDRNALFREVHGDHIENAYVLKVINLDSVSHRYRLEAAGLEQLAIVAPSEVIELAPGSVSTLSARLQVPSDKAAGIHVIALSLIATDDARIAVHERTRFIGPHS